MYDVLCVKGTVGIRPRIQITSNGRFGGGGSTSGRYDLVFRSRDLYYQEIYFSNSQLKWLIESRSPTWLSGFLQSWRRVSLSSSTPPLFLNYIKDQKFRTLIFRIFEIRTKMECNISKSTVAKLTLRTVKILSHTRGKFLASIS